MITIVGTKLASKQPDKNHPYGHGRAEYLSAMLIAFFVLYAGVTAFVESVKKIIEPQTPGYSSISLIIIAVAVVVKIVLGLYVKKTGRKVNSDSLVNSGKDALFDSVISASTLVAAGIFLVFHVSLEAWFGAAISIYIIKSGVDMLRETISKLLGEKGDSAFGREIKETVEAFPEISGAYDLVLHNYGPETYHGSIHIEIPDTLKANEVDNLIRAVSLEVFKKHGVILTAVGIYSVNTRDEASVKAREKLMKIALSADYITQIHGFYLEEAEKKIRFDMVVSFDAPNRRTAFEAALEKVREAFSGYTVEATMDTDFFEE